ncbi:hypothetical protein T439DRAFT_382467 [Meredithblackwellia eburnea MCA 4105]
MSYQPKQQQHQPSISKHKRRLPSSPPPEQGLAKRATATTTTCTFYNHPLATDTLPVYSQVNISWNPSCVKTMSSSTIDLYLSVQEDDGLTAVHEWSGVPYQQGYLETQLKPTWWNASTGAGSVSAQFSMTAHGSQIWDTAVPSGPLFVISYNGSYPASVTDTSSSPVYTGPSVESVSNPSSSNAVSGGRLAAAVIIPVLAAIAALCGYVAWNKFKKRKDTKRWSAVIDQRMSMISQGTWVPPGGRPSMSSNRNSQAGSMHHHPNGSVSSFGSRGAFHGASGSVSSFSNGRPMSTFSQSGQQHSPSSPLRPLPPAEMRQIGQGERTSRVSFSDSITSGGAGGAIGHNAGRPSFSSSRKHPGPSSLRNGTSRSSYYANNASGNSNHEKSPSLGASFSGSVNQYSPTNVGSGGPVTSATSTSPNAPYAEFFQDFTPVTAPPPPAVVAGGIPRNGSTKEELSRTLSSSSSLNISQASSSNASYGSMPPSSPSSPSSYAFLTSPHYQQSRTRKQSNLSSAPPRTSPQIRDSLVEQQNLARELENLPAMKVVANGDLAFEKEDEEEDETIMTEGASESTLTEEQQRELDHHQQQQQRQKRKSRTSTHMPRLAPGGGSGVAMSPDDLLRSYADKRDELAATNKRATMGGGGASSSSGKKSGGGLLKGPKRMIRSFSSKGSLASGSSSTVTSPSLDHDSSRSPFADPSTAPSSSSTSSVTSAPNSPPQLPLFPTMLTSPDGEDAMPLPPPIPAATPAFDDAGNGNRQTMMTVASQYSDAEEVQYHQRASVLNWNGGHAM